MQNSTGKLMERIVASLLRTWKGEIYSSSSLLPPPPSPNQRGYRAGKKNNLGKHSQIRIRCCLIQSQYINAGATCSAEHRSFARAWFSAHPGCSISREHVASTQGSDWLLSKPTFLSQMAGWGDVPTGSKNNGLNQPKAQEPCTMHCTCHKKIE